MSTKKANYRDRTLTHKSNYTPLLARNLQGNPSIDGSVMIRWNAVYSERFDTLNSGLRLCLHPGYDTVLFLGECHSGMMLYKQTGALSKDRSRFEKIRRTRNDNRHLFFR